MELLSTFSSINPQNFTLQKFLIVFPQKKNTLRRFLIFSEMQPWTFRSELEKIPKSTLHFLHFRTCNILALILKSLKEKKPWKNFLIFPGMELFSSSIKKFQKKILIFQKAETVKEFLIFQEMELFSPTPENIWYFRK